MVSQIEQAILSKLEKVTGPDSQGNYMALCPFHNDRNTPNLSVIFVKGCYNCFACGSKGNITRLAQRLGIMVDDNGHKSAEHVGEASTSGQPCQRVNGRPKQLQNRVDNLADRYVNGVKLATLAEAKRLAIDFLKSLGIGDKNDNGRPAVRIPYYSEEGQEIAVRFRLALTGDSRFRWRKGDHVLPYGLDRLAMIRKAGWVLIVEGETDCWTCWLHGIPVLGAPGKVIWPPEWGKYLQGLRVFVWQEPKAEDFVLQVLKSAPNLRYIRAPEGIKDISEAHIQGFNIPAWLEELKAEAESGQALKDQYTSEQLKHLYQEARAVIEADDPLKLIEDAIRGLGYGGDTKPALITYLAMTSRLLEMRPGAMPVHLLLTGPSSGGKSYTLGVIKAIMPPEGYHIIDAGSPRVLIYDEAPLEHKALVFGEADSLPAGEDNPAASAIRNLLQDHHLHYEVTIRDTETGKYQTKRVHKPGPTVLVTTSTRSLGDQLMTRFFSLEIGDSKEQISAALVTQAKLEIKGMPRPEAGLVAFQSYLQLKTPVRIIVPFAEELVAGMVKMASAPRIHRDFARLMSLIKAVTLIRHHQRQLDGEGHIVAELADYETVRVLVNDMYIDSSTGATSEVRALVKAVRALDATRGDGERITNTTLAKHLGTGIKQVTRRAKRAIKQGWLVNREQRKSYPADYAPGEPMPETEGLPLLDVDTDDSVDNERVQDSSLKNEGVDRLTPLTDSDVHPHASDYPVHLCPVCGCGDYWLREASQWGSPEWLCSRCHPKPA